ncbi:excinuclease ABC subunit UvrA [Corynebacterium sp. MSK218]|uniref:excinuclease ABC subunit UvrA n=1 Tax=Corynebacterium sp. MSK218 TaxID=3050218 RepID=UPI00254F3245|nr:excinuclease ABC subunit UvrA [Corynebacterium sp. MSK218]MDK8762420.1 excinuclease ABC subunit UvrA [Corynebacterium sp. MSK218]
MEQEFITVTGARENNLKNVNARIPKRALTVFTGVSGSGKTSLVFDTIATESQRLINETYPGFVQGFMQAPPRPDVDQLEGLTAAIVVGQEPMAASARSTFGTATDITGHLRVLFSRLAEPRAGGPAAYSFNVPSASGQGAIEVNGVKEVRRFERTGGMCPRCEGRGEVGDVDKRQLVDESLSLNDGAIVYPGMKADSWMWRAYAESGLYPADVPVKDFTEEQKRDLYETETKVKVGGINMSYMGLVTRLKTNVLSKPVESLQKHMRAFVERAVVFVACPDCHGTRLAQHARESYINGVSIADVCAMELADASSWLRTLTSPLAAAPLRGLEAALDLGLGYLTLERPTGTLSGGEAQRTRMVRHIGSALTDVTYVFDEPTAGLHPHDVTRMNELLLQLRDKGNTVLVVEHNPETMAIADCVVQLGPGAGAAGGEIVSVGDAPTMSGKVQLKEEVRTPTGVLEICGASRNNLKNIDVDIPLGVLTVITGVAGSGKSSLMNCVPDSDRVLIVDQSPLSGSRRSNPATYTGAMDALRKAFAKANEGATPGMFSFNSDGACPACSGAGVVTVEFGAMDSADVPCEVCEGRRFAADVLDYELAGKNIADVLALPAVEAVEYCTVAKVPAAKRVCEQLVAVGLGYLTLGQPLSTLSGGERQRLKLAVRLCDRKATADIIVLDEPTVGLHREDVNTLLALFDDLVDSSLTLICVEHHRAVVAHADHIIDLGPGAGSAGGEIVAACSPREFLETGTVTARYLAQVV